MASDGNKPAATLIAGSTPTPGSGGHGAAGAGAPPDGAEASLMGEVLDGRYRIIKKLGEGGMGEVYAAEHVHIEKRVAVKLLARRSYPTPRQ